MPKSNAPSTFSSKVTAGKGANLLVLSDLLRRAKQRERLEDDFPSFVRWSWPMVEGRKPLKWNWHIDLIGEYLLAWRQREINNLIINIPFRCMKSLLCSAMYPAWVWTDEPEHQFLTLSHGDTLATRDALKSRRIITHELYQDNWGARFQMAGDQNMKSRYENNRGGYRIALGMTAGGTGEGGDSIIFDDPHDAQKAQSDAERERSVTEYDQKWSNRLNDPVHGGQLIIMQRLHHVDLVGHVLQGEETIEHWEHLCLPMEYEGRRYVPGFKPLKAVTRQKVDEKGADYRVTRKRTPAVKTLKDPRKKERELLWKDRFPRSRVESFARRLGSYGAAGQLQQRPSPAGGGILKRAHWRMWPKGKPFPKVLYVIQSYDTAFSDEDFEDNSYSARTTWGVWHDEQAGKNRVLLLEAWRDHVEYPDLRRKAKRDYRDWAPDRALIEKKASGQSLIQDLRRATVRVAEYQPDRDKVARAYACQALLEGGFVYYPDRLWAEDVIEECEIFPKGEFDDYVDTCTQAWLWLMNHHWIHITDQPDYETKAPRKKRKAAYG